MDQHKILKVALTGGICCGKSEVQKCWEWMGAKVIDLDNLAHKVLNRPDVADAIFKTFGDGVRSSDISLVDRQKLGKIVFRDATKRKQLEDLVHPLVNKLWDNEWVAAMGKQAVIVAAHPLLFEMKDERHFNTIVVVGCLRETQIDRLVKTRGLSPQQAQLRLDAQLPALNKLKKADYIIWTEADRDLVWQQAAIVWTNILQQALELKGRALQL